ncbi:Ig-like domain-containing protein [Patulibacter defluvii]|uniref:Ig-like domain-containing protein n=1 Tax=Patulibacter defluvii TaxID=3095358 RepID=UPI002A75530B|nr:Ig-like domain-containing protein [Patulibacter sp. DM4]
MSTEHGAMTAGTSPAATRSARGPLRTALAFLAALIAIALVPAGASAYEVNSAAWTVSGTNASNTLNASGLSVRETVSGPTAFEGAGNQPLNGRGYVASDYAPSLAATTNTVANLTNIPDTSSSSCPLRPNYQVTYCEWTGVRPTVTVNFGRPVTNPVIHVAGLGGFRQVDNPGYTTFSSAILNLSSSMTAAGATLTNVGGSKIKVTQNNTRVEATVDAPSTSCTQVSNGAQGTAGCGSFRVNGTFSSVTFDLSYKISTSHANPQNGWEIFDDGWNLTTSVTQDYGDAPSSYDAGNAARHVISDIRYGTTVTEENANVANGTSSPNAGGSDDDDGLPGGLDPIDVVSGTSAATSVTIPISRASAAGRACAWIDFNRNGTFEAGERQCVDVAAGATSAAFSWPGRSGVSTGGSWARFRIGYNAAQVESPTGPADSGEVEDYPVELRAVTPSLTLDKSVDPESFGGPGETLTYTFTVTNGPAELTDFQLNDPHAGLSAFSCSPVAIGGTLPADGTTKCTATYQTTQADVDNGSVDNTATATGKDAGGNTVTSNEDSTSAPLDPSPTANPDETSGPQGQPQSIDPLANDEAGDDSAPLDPASLTLLDADGNPTDRVEVPGQGVYTIEDGKIVFTPEPDFIGEADPVDYRVADVNGKTARSTYTPTVTPVAQPDESRGPQGQPQSVDPLANDNVDPDVTLDPSTLTLVDGDGNPVDRVEVPGQGVYTIEDGKIVFTPEPQFTGEADPVRYQVKDSEGNTVESNYTPTVDPVTPTANPDETRGPQGIAQSTDPFANDEPGDDAVPLDRSSLTLLDGAGNPVDRVEVPGQGVYTVEDGKIVFTPEPQFTGEADPVKYRIGDVNGTPAESTYTPTVDPVTPTANPDETEGPQGRPQSVDPFANDTPGDDSVPLDRSSLTLLDGDGNPVDRVEVPGQGVYTVEDGKIVFTPEPDFIGTADPVDYRIADVNGTPAESTYTPKVTPVAQPDETRGPQGVRQTVDPLANDNTDPNVTLDPDTLTLVDNDGNPVDRVEVPGQGVYTIEDGEIVFTPEPQFTGEATPVRYQVKDSEGNTVESTYTPTVDPVTPTANPDETRGPQGQPQSTDPFANDEPGDEQVPLDRGSLTLLDGAGNPVDRVEVPGQGVYTIEDGKIVFTPEPQFTGEADPVKYRIADVNGTPAESTYTPTLDPVTPTANPDETRGPQGRPQSIDPLANDTPGDDSAPLDPSTLTLLDGDGNPVERVEVPGQGVYTIEDGKIVFTPEPQFTGTADPVKYQVKDKNGTPAESTYTPTLDPVTPTANPDETRGPQGQPQSTDPFANDEPGDDQVPLDRESLTLLDGDGNPTDRVEVPGQGVYTVEDGKIVFTPEPQFTGAADPVDYRIKDVNGTPADSTYTPTLDPVTPEANPDETRGPQGRPQSIDPLANDEPGDDSAPLDPETLTLLDGDGNPVHRVEVPGQGVYTVEDGKIVFTPEPQFTGQADPVKYQVKDRNGTPAESTYTPTVDPVAPKANPDTTRGPQGQPQSTDPFANDEPGDDAVPLDRDSLQLLDKDGNPADRVVVPGQGVYTVKDGRIVFTPEPQFIGTADPVRYRIKDVNGTPAESTYTPTVTPVARPDETSGPQGERQVVDPLANDNTDPNVRLDPGSLTLVDQDGKPTNRVVVPGQGVYTVEDGKIVFTPEPQFVGKADPVRYQVKDSQGNTIESTYTPTVTPKSTPVPPTASPDTSSGPQGKRQVIDPFANDTPGSAPLDRGSLTLLDADGNPTNRVVIPGQGVYTIEDGKIVFTPEPQFTGTATPVRYRIKDVNGNPAESTYTPTVTPAGPKPKLRLTKTANAKRVTAGQRVKYTIKVRNDGKGAARNVVVCDILPRNVTVVARGGGKLKRGKLCFRTISSLAPGKAKSYRITVRIDRDAPKGSQVNRATATATGIKALKASRKVVIRPKKAPTTDKTVVTG